MPASTGHAEIDAEHDEILKRINDLVVMVLQSADEAAVLSQCDMVFDYLQTHFGHEEALLNELGSSDAELIRSEHKRLLRQMRLLKDSFMADPEAYRDSEKVGRLRDIYLRHVAQFDVPIIGEATTTVPAQD